MEGALSHNSLFVSSKDNFANQVELVTQLDHQRFLNLEVGRGVAPKRVKPKIMP